MTLIKQIAAFAREYVNDPNARTEERNSLIASAALKYLGRTLSTCQTCHVEAVFELLKMQHMEETEYRLCNGALLDNTFSRADLYLVNGQTFTDELAELHLAIHPENVKFFQRLPEGFEGISQERELELRTKFDYWDNYEKPECLEEATEEESEAPKKRGRKPKAE